ncbi:MAG TPA: AAA family ATPase [Candidatus Acidoferrum sp.]|nr:AAA family ATPase [Candidatus Acidoferrum sp.]
MKRIAIYGKGGIGKSTVTSNVAAALAADGLAVMQIGCDPKADSTLLHTIGVPTPTILSLLRDGNFSLDRAVRRGSDGVLCAECGGPPPGTGCAGRGVVAAFEALAGAKAFEIYRPDVVLYDVLGDVVCGGFAMPLRGGYAKDVFIVTSGEKMSLYAAANISLALASFKGRGYATLTGFIGNRRDVEGEEAAIAALAAEAGAPVVAMLARDPLIAAADAAGTTTLCMAPESPAAAAFVALAKKLMEVSTDA